MGTLEKLQNQLIDLYGCHKTDFIDNYMDLNDDLGLDSLDRTDFFMWCEKEFQISINSYEQEKLETLHQLADYIDNRNCTCFTHAARKYCKRDCIDL